MVCALVKPTIMARKMVQASRGTDPKRPAEPRRAESRHDREAARAHIVSGEGKGAAKAEETERALCEMRLLPRSFSVMFTLHVIAISARRGAANFLFRRPFRIWYVEHLELELTQHAAPNRIPSMVVSFGALKLYER
jgi:hypothetical protein